MSVQCEKCSAVIITDHIRIGLTIDCPVCGARTSLSYTMGSSIPPTGWSLSFTDFAQLLNDRSYRPRIGPMVERWFEGTIENTSAGVSVRNRDGSFLTAEAIHLAIQSDAKRQHELYQAAMDLWR